MRWWLLVLAGCGRVLGFDPVIAHNQSPRALVFDNSSSQSDLDNFPVPITLDDHALDYAQIADPTMDLRFADSDGDLPFEIEHWDPAGKSIVWILVRHIPAGATNAHVLMYYGADAQGSEAPSAVWSDYALVFHGDALVDSANPADVPRFFADNQTMMPPTHADGQIGNAVQFQTVVGQRVDFPMSKSLIDTWSALTLELWLEPTYDPAPALGTNEPLVFDKPGTLSIGRIFNTGHVSGGPLTMQVDFKFAVNAALYPQVYVPNNDWSYFAYVYDGQFVIAYHNGVAIRADATPTKDMLASGGNALTVGGSSSRAPCQCIIDELRVSARLRSSDWLEAQTLAMTGHFVTIRDP